MTSLTGSAAATRGDGSSETLHGWKLFAPIPDRIGFGGMLAGVLNGRLVAGGGSQFPEKPLWLKGDKLFSDKIYTLSAPDAHWVEHAMRLPAPIAGCANAATADAIYAVGGLNAGGCVRTAWKMSAQGDGFEFTLLPELPHAIGYASAAIVGRILFVVGGVETPVSKTPSTEVWSLDLDARHAKWHREPDLPGPGVFVSAAASDGKQLYIFGGLSFDDAGTANPSKRAYRLVPGAANWDLLADLPTPRVGVSTPCPVIQGDKIFLIGGYEEMFAGALREHPGFCAQTLCFELSRQRWENGPLLPVTPVVDRDLTGDAGPTPMIGAPCMLWHDFAVVIGGEVRPSVRTPAVLGWPIRTGNQTSR